ncbi:MAG: hypothetical protein Q9227_009151 [Pyrenula ochraceoflavens]
MLRFLCAVSDLPFNPLDNFPSDFPDGRLDKDAQGNPITSKVDGSGVPWVSTLIDRILSVVPVDYLANPVFYTDAATPPDVMKQGLEDYILKQLKKKGYSFKSGTPVDWLKSTWGVQSGQPKGTPAANAYWTIIYRASEALAMTATASGNNKVEAFVFMKLNSYDSNADHPEVWKVDPNSKVGSGYTWYGKQLRFGANETNLLYTEMPTLMRNKRVTRTWAVDPDDANTKVAIWDETDQNHPRDFLQFTPMDTIKGVQAFPSNWFPWYVDFQTLLSDLVHRISNETLGIAAHAYSNKKLPFLKKAKDAYEAALENLPSSPFTVQDKIEFTSTPLDDPFCDKITDLELQTRNSTSDSLNTLPIESSATDHLTISYQSSSYHRSYSPSPATSTSASTRSTCQEYPISTNPKAQPHFQALPQSSTLANIEACLTTTNTTPPTSPSSIRSYNATLLVNAYENSPDLLPLPLAFGKNKRGICPAGPPPATPLPPLPPSVAAHLPATQQLQKQTGHGTSVSVYASRDKRNEQARGPAFRFPSLFPPRQGEEEVQITPTKLSSAAEGTKTAVPPNILTPTKASTLNLPAKQAFGPKPSSPPPTLTPSTIRINSKANLSPYTPTAPRTRTMNIGPMAAHTSAMTPTPKKLPRALVLSPALASDLAALKSGNTLCVYNSPARSPVSIRGHEQAYNSHLQDLRPQIEAHIVNIELRIRQVEGAQMLRKRNRGKAGTGMGREEKSYWLLNNNGREKSDVMQERIERLRAEGWEVKKEKWGWKGEAWYRGIRERAIDEVVGL